MNLALLRGIVVPAVIQLAAPHGQTGRDISAADSMRLVRSVRSAQSSFEAFRRARLPIGEHMSGPCDIRIGRYCYWRGDEDDSDAPSEPPAIRDRRKALLELLDSAASIIPGDTWVDGQFVRYLVEAERFDDAIAFTRRCTAEASWCFALAGYAAHAAGRFALADSAFRHALSAMQPAERCRWLDISSLLDDDLAKRFEQAGCDGREVFVRRLMTIAAPMYSVSTTDLFTEHLARVTRARIAERAATTDGESWADDQRELVTRYGWPRWYSRWEPEFGSQMDRAVTGHDAGMPFDFIPSIHAFDHVSEISDDDWHLDDPRAVTGYAPSYARSVHTLASQIGVFRRGDSLLVVAAWDARRDTTMLGRRLEARLAVLGDSSVRVARLDSVGAVGRIWTTALVDSGVASLELLAPKERRATRGRRGVATSSKRSVALSDLLLYEPDPQSPTRLSDVRDKALASAELAGARHLGVFWEAYGVGERGERVRYTLNVEQVGVSWLRRAAERAHLADRTGGLRIRWEERPTAERGIASRAVRLDLSALRSGRYRIELAMDPDGGPAVVSSRLVELR